MATYAINMDNRIDLIRADLQKSSTLAEITEVQKRVDLLIDETQDMAEMSLIEAEGALLAVGALRRRIFVENPHGLDATGEPSQLPAEDD